MPTMYDSETPVAVPADAEIVAAYVDGNWPDYDEMVALHPNAKHVSITVEGRAGAMVGDLEKGNFGPGDVFTDGAKWAKSEVEAGRRPTLYYSKDNAGVVAAALAAEGVALSSVDFWVAEWTGSAHLIPGSVATQWASPGTGSGGNFDISETIEAWPVVSGSPAPEPTPQPVPEPAPSPQPTGGFMPPTLREGEVSGSVRSLQALLNLHAPLTVDGVFGPKTLEAVQNFQKIMHLAVDGIVGPQTWTALDTFG